MCTFQLFAACLAGTLHFSSVAQTTEKSSALGHQSASQLNSEDTSDLDTLVERELEYLAKKRRLTNEPSDLSRISNRQAALHRFKADIASGGRWIKRTAYFSRKASQTAFSSYVQAVSDAIAKYGTENFPKSGGASIYGEAVVILRIGKDGEILEIEVVKKSGVPEIDAHAVETVRSSGPFAAFTPEMSKVADYLVVPFPFRYSKEVAK